MCFLFFRFLCLVFSFFFFFNDTATTEIYTLSYTTLFRSLVAHARRSRACAGARARRRAWRGAGSGRVPRVVPPGRPGAVRDRKSTRLNSSHGYISYAVFCLKKKNTHQDHAPGTVAQLEES